MAIIDYGAIAFKNGKLISTDMFTDMKETCGFSDKDNLLPGADMSFDGNCFVTVGNKQFLLGFYKTTMYWWQDRKWKDKEDADFDDDYPRYTFGYEMFGWSDYTWKKWKNEFYLGRGCYDTTSIIVKHKNGYYVARFNIGRDRYKVYFGYGVDLGFYKKTRRVNYYRSPEYWVYSHIISPIKWKFYKIKHKKD